MWFIVVLSLVGVAQGFISDTSCTAQGVYAASAVNCQNVYNDDACLSMYFNNTAIVVGGNSERPSRCFNGTNNQLNRDMRAMAVASCPRLCGYCCLTPAFNCKNAPYPRISCASVTSSMCQSPQWRELLATDCPNVCGFCQLNGCVDAAADCASQPQICVTAGLEAFVATNCRRTCNICSSPVPCAGK